MDNNTETPAAHQFLSLAELIQHLGHFLEDDDMTYCTLTNHSLRDGLYSHGYRRVDARRPYTSNGHIYDFRHICQYGRFVETLTAYDTFVVATLEPKITAFVNLTELTLEMSDISPPGTLTEPVDITAVYDRISQSPLLETLRIRNVQYNDARSMRVLFRTLSSLIRLRVLSLASDTSRTTSTLMSTLFYCCPPLLEHLTLQCAGRDNSEIDLGNESTDFPHLPLVLRESPTMLHLKQLLIPCQAVLFLASTLLDILVNCPVLVDTSLPGMYLPDAEWITTWSRHYDTKHQQLIVMQGPLEHTDIISNYIQLIPEKKIAHLIIPRLWEQSHGQISTSLQRHFQSLCVINFSEVLRISSTCLREILISCPNIEELEVTNIGGWEHRTSITLGDAVAESWVCTRLKKLTMAVRIALDTYDSDFDFVNDVSENDRRAMFREAMVRLAQQLGQLTELEELDLRRSGREVIEAGEPVMDNSEVGINAARDQNYPFRKPTGYRNGWLHGLLTLGNPDTGNPNTLCYFKDLSKLIVVKGTLQENEQEYHQNMRSEEATWIRNNWRSLVTLEVMYEGFRQDMNQNTFNLSEALNIIFMIRGDVQLVNKAQHPLCYESYVAYMNRLREWNLSHHQ